MLTFRFEFGHYFDHIPTISLITAEERLNGGWRYRVGYLRYPTHRGSKVTYSYPKIIYSDHKVTHSDSTLHTSTHLI